MKFTLGLVSILPDNLSMVGHWINHYLAEGVQHIFFIQKKSIRDVHRKLRFYDAYITIIQVNDVDAVSGDIINNKVKENECIILNPTINDLFENNLYKLKVNNATYIIPLWHNELVYDNDGNDIYIKCNPMLPENIEIDATNNICMHITRNILDIWGKDVVKLDIGKHTIPITISQLKLVPVQTIVFAKMGISKINTKDVYDVSKKSDLHIILTLQL